MTPLSVIGGFLGAGKTTLINQLLAEGCGRRLAVLVNDFGAVNIDAALIAGHDGETIALTNGCLCCSIGDSLIAALDGLQRRRVPLDHILVEASGVADPARVADLARLDPALALDGIIVLVDAERIRGQLVDRHIGDTVRRQIDGADMIVLNKMDLPSAEAGRLVLDELRRLWPDLPLVTTTGARVPAAILLEPAAGLPAPAAPNRLSAPADHAAQFLSWCFEADRPFAPQPLAQLLDRLGGGVLRAKGTVFLAGDPAQAMLLQLAGRRWSLAPHPRSEPSGRSQIVFIGLRDSLRPTALAARLAAALVPRRGHRAGAATAFWPESGRPESGATE